MVDSPYYRAPDGGDEPTALPSPRSERWVVVATASTPQIATEILERFEVNQIVGRSRPIESIAGPVFEVQVPESEEERASAFIEGDAYDLLEYQGFSRYGHHDEDDDARGGFTTVVIIFGVLFAVCVLLLLAS